MQWTTIKSKTDTKDGYNHEGHNHRKGFKGQCLHPLFGAGVAAIIVAAALLTLKVVL